MDSLKADDLAKQYGYWKSHPDFSVEEWQAEVANNETRVGYWQWVEARLNDS